MATWTAALILVLSQGFLYALALPRDRLDASVNANIDAGTFSNPSNNVRPKFRYWLPDASVDPALVADDIAELAGVGIGGFELLNYYLYGGTLGFPVVDYSIYGFGTPAYNDLLVKILQAAKNDNLLVDFEIGPESGQGVPAEPTNPGLSYQLVSSNTTISASGGSFNGTIPGYGSGDLVSVVTFAILRSRLEVYYNTVDGQPVNYTAYTIDHTSLLDVTGQVSSSGQVTLDFTTNSSVQAYVVYASYSQLSGARACVGGSNPQNFIQNGSFAVDHFSAAGANVTTSFLEKYVFVNGVKELLQEVGNYIWEDSVEIATTVSWTPALPATFLNMHGYDIGRYAPLLQDNNQNYIASRPSSTWFYLDTEDGGQQFIDDYRTTLATLAATYLDALAEWSHEYADMQFSAQVGYNYPVDMQELVPIPDAPESESLAFINNVDAYRQYSGPANLAGRRIISVELGAVLFQTYATTFPQQLGFVKRAFAGGHNEMVFHGATYSHQYPNTTWPGFTTFSYLFSDMHSRHQPAWPQGYKSLMDYVGRSQFILQSGVPKIDVVFYNKVTAQNNSLPTIYPYDDLNEAGYTYTYISPANFDLPQAVVTDNILAKDGPAFKAIIVQSTALLTVDGATNITRWAQDGLPVVFSGGVPTSYAGSDVAAQVEANNSLRNILQLSNVHQVAAGPVANTLSSIGIEPNIAVSTITLWYTVIRQTLDNSTYLYVYNDGNSSTGTVSLNTTRPPYLYNLNTGTIEPVLVYHSDAGRTTTPLSLGAGEAVVLGFLDTSNTSAPTVHAVENDFAIAGYTFSDDKGLTAKAIRSTNITTSDGQTHEINVPSLTQIVLSNWTLTAESWNPPSNLSDIETIAVKVNTTHTLPTLMPWSEIPGLSNTSGIGYYSTQFTMANGTGAMIDFGPVIHTLSVRINGQPIPPLDLARAVADISSYLVNGTNTVEAVTATTLFNGLRPILGQLETSGSSNMFAASLLQANPDQNPSGLVGEVVVTPYTEVLLGSG